MFLRKPSVLLSNQCILKGKVDSTDIEIASVTLTEDATASASASATARAATSTSLVPDSGTVRDGALCWLSIFLLLRLL